MKSVSGFHAIFLETALSGVSNAFLGSKFQWCVAVRAVFGAHGTFREKFNSASAMLTVALYGASIFQHRLFLVAMVF